MQDHLIGVRSRIELRANTFSSLPSTKLLHIDITKRLLGAQDDTG